MKKLSIISAIVLAVASGSVLADNHSFSVGYAQSNVQSFRDIRGVNLQYRYEWDSPVSIMGSFSWMKGDGDQQYHDSGDSVKNKVDAKYYSLLAGPAFRINDYVSLYAVGGVAHVKANGETLWTNSDGYFERDTISKKSTSFAYGAGIMVNPVDNMSVNVGYEGTSAELGDNYSINGFNIGVGYRF
ncbi:Ail/Lom family outer membrane beta-barrel protein [Escherichia coli]|uniref:Ail/Lom family outer membrane beta-barrel protein n=1 Tax=Escherichia coli TaxID=562 RepID=UPI0038B3627B